MSFVVSMCRNLTFYYEGGNSHSIKMQISFRPKNSMFSNIDLFADRWSTNSEAELCKVLKLMSF